MMTAKDGISVEDGGESVSDCSVEEISEAYFKKDRHRHRFAGGGGGGGGGRSRGWSRENMLRRYHPHMLSRTSYTSNLYNFAWAQAVQNKPLRFAEAAAATTEKGAGDDALMMDGEAKNEAKKEDVLEKEEGELEEGEIDDLEFVGERTCDSSVILEGEEKANNDDEDVLVVPVNLPDDSIEEDKMVADDKKKNNSIINDRNEVEDGGIENIREIAGKEEREFKEEDTENLDMRVISVLEDLEINDEDAEKSFEGACSRLQKALENLRKMILEGHLPLLDAVIQQAFIGVKTIHSVFLRGQDQNKDAYCRFLSFIKRQKSLVFAQEQIKEIDSMIQALGSKYVDVVDDSISSSEPKRANSSVDKGGNGSPTSSRLPRLEPLVIPRAQTGFSPLLDPHVIHDEGSLPSPTRESATPSLLPGVACSGDVAAAAAADVGPTTYRQETYNGPVILPYVMDAFRAVSTYQKKYNHISRISNNELPSPTPSEETNGDSGDTHGEVSSSCVANARAVHGNTTSLNTVDSSSHLHQVGYMPSPTVKASAKSRDPRLRFSNLNTVDPLDSNKLSAPSGNEEIKNDPRLRFTTSNMVGSLDFNKQTTPSRNEEMKNGVDVNVVMNSRKQKSLDEQIFNHSIKRQRNESSFSNGMEISSSRGGWLDDNSAMAFEYVSSSCSMDIANQKEFDNMGSNSCTRHDVVTEANGVCSRNNPAEIVNTIPDGSLPSLLKGIAVNPTLLMHLLKEQQRLAAESQHKAVNSGQNATSSSSTNGPAGVAVSIDSILKTPESEHRPVGSTQLTPGSTMVGSQNESGRPRMKPRDPRRILHNNMIQRNGGLDPEHSRPSLSPPSNTIIVNDCKTVAEQGWQAQSSSPPSQSTLPPNPTCQLTKRTVSIKSGGTSAPQISSFLTSEVNTTSTSQSSNPWGDVGHLLSGYDEKQKAAFQRERARRIEEQSKMFASRKLCLVLDLDHTLLNSAKFAEVEQLHDEILKRKEEQDREKPQRHLFRFQHMAMWTKLRPGIWNFLEKASKLFELHLYTMGNNLYATEMAKVLDPTGKLFSGRVISKGDDNDLFDGDDRVPKSKDLEGVLGMESAVVIIDDSVKVWPHHKLNLIVVERYTYFPSSRRQFGLLGPSLLEIDHDERPDEGTLASSLAVIERIHQNFFSHASLDNVDVRNILASEQRQILCGCRILFSRVIPVGVVNPHLHPIWQTAEQFGAVCTNQIDDQVTHVVANSLGTDKVNWALSTGRFVVHPGWVEASALLYRRANEADFVVKHVDYNDF